MSSLKYLFIFLLFLASCNNFAQDNNKNWFVSTAFGVQISGIKPVDFVQSNVTPSFVFNFGKWVTPDIGLQIGYKGFYFHTISDNDKHYYNFIYGDILFNLNKIFNFANSTEARWNLIIHPGAGYFYNKYYNQPNICANIGLLNSIKIVDQIDIFIDISAIFGWDIYQGDEDILPGCVLGMCYSFK